MKIFKEFKEFAIKGNVFDMAVGIIIGTAFSKVVSSLVNDLILPPLGFLIKKVNFQDLQLIIQPEMKNETGAIIREMITFNYGNFIQVLVDFLVIAVTIFLVIKVFNKLRKKAENVQDTTVPTPKDVELLTEIRDILKNK